MSQYTKCIVTGEEARQRIVLQYTAVYCDRHSALFQSLFGHCSWTLFIKKFEKKKIFFLKNKIKSNQMR